MEVDLTPRQIVHELDKHIIGQDQAKRALAVALRNRIRRRKLPPEMQAEISPKNIMLIGSTGVGKTELARRLARLVGAPFIKVEATKYTEVGYVGRDVESMVRDLVENALQMVRSERTAEVQSKAEARTEERLLDAMLPGRKAAESRNPFEMLFGASNPQPLREHEHEGESSDSRRARREELRRRLRAGELEDLLLEVEVTERSQPMFDLFANSGMGDMGSNLQDMFGNLLPKKKKRRKVPVSQARKLFLQEEVDNLIDQDEIAQIAVERAEQTGIIFIDEIDKIAASGSGHGPDVSREGVQRDILPIVEGSTVMTKHGPVLTDYVLFIAAGAFHVSKPSDLIPELQGRFPIRVELTSLEQADLERILVEPENALLEQYQALLSTESIALSFTPDAIAEIARIAHELNVEGEDIGARRLHTVLERLMEEISFEPSPDSTGCIEIDADYVRQRLSGILQNKDLSRYIL
jgi:ATP-dependent HslUV protease ATP-binding subunit HslU